MASSTVENYLKRLYMLEQTSEQPLVAMGKLAQDMAVTPGTATSMVRTLADAGLVDYEPRSGVALTHSGRQLALHVLRRHRLIELFLVEVLGLDWSEVHDEAEELEHAISEKVLEKIDALLGHPEADPHGDPIPNAQGVLPHRPVIRLADCQLDQTFTLYRVNDQDPEFLRFLDERGMRPGVAGKVVENSEPADSVVIELTDSPSARSTVNLGRLAAARIMVEGEKTRQD